jgi:hypothetical protein
MALLSMAKGGPSLRLGKAAFVLKKNGRPWHALREYARNVVALSEMEHRTAGEV